MRFLISCVFLVLAFGAISECHHGENVFRKLEDDIKDVADKFAHDVKGGAEDVGHVAKDFGDDVDHALEDFRIDVELAFGNAKPFLEKALVHIDGATKTLAEVGAVAELIELLAEASA